MTIKDFGWVVASAGLKWEVEIDMREQLVVNVFLVLFLRNAERLFSESEMHIEWIRGGFLGEEIWAL